WVNNPTLTEFCFSMIGRADIEGSKSNVAMNAWLCHKPVIPLFGTLICLASLPFFSPCMHPPLSFVQRPSPLFLHLKFLSAFSSFPCPRSFLPSLFPALALSSSCFSLPLLFTCPCFFCISFVSFLSPRHRFFLSLILDYFFLSLHWYKELSIERPAPAFN
ncbi:hypothetical protein K457DRAFT_74295, partial [Linnemannia elongata AG-77]